MNLVTELAKNLKTTKTLVGLEVIGKDNSNYKGILFELEVKSLTSSNIHTEIKPSLAIDPVSAIERRCKKIVWNRSTGRRSYTPLRQYDNFIIKSEIWKDSETGALTKKERK